MKSGRYLYAGAVVVALVVGLGFWKPAHVKADRDHVPRFRVDASWPQELPAPTGYNWLTWPSPGGFPNTLPAGNTYPTVSNTAASNTTANRWVQGEVAGNATDQWDNIYTINRGWQTGITFGGTTYNAESGAIDGNDATTAHALPSPPIVALDPDGKTIKDRSFGNPTLWPYGTSSGAYNLTNVPGVGAGGRSAYMPYGSHGIFVDYQGYVWTGGNGDGVVQKYNPAVAGPAGASATWVMQIGTKDVCDTTTGVCGAAVSGANVALNHSTTLLNEPPDISVDPEVGPVSGTRGDIYVADGYGNARVVVFNHSGQYVGQWGTSCGYTNTGNGTTTPSAPVSAANPAGVPCPAGTFGTGAGHPHCVVLGNDGLVYVCDRPNSRIQVFKKTCAGTNFTNSNPGTTIAQPPIAMVISPARETAANNYYESNQPVCAPERVIYISNFPGNYPTVVSPKIQAALFAGTRACDMDLYPNIDYLADLSPTHQKYIVDTDLDGDNNYILEKPTSGHGDVTSTTPIVGFVGRDSCGFGPCPGHNAGEFAYSHTNSVDSKGNIYVAETITGRRIQKFVPVDDDDDDHGHHDH